MDKFTDWFNKFLSEKSPPFEVWNIKDADGNTHIIDSGIVAETILQASSPAEQEKIKYILVQIDFRNGSVNHFFHHLATGIVNQYEGVGR